MFGVIKVDLSFKVFPFNIIEPELIFSKPARHFKKVVFPDPLSPIKETIQVAPGWHQVSYFPPNMSIDTGSMNQNRKMRDLIQIARQDVLVDQGQTVRVVLSYRSLEGEALEYEQRLKSSRWVGLGMVAIMFALMTWAM